MFSDGTLLGALEILLKPQLLQSGVLLGGVGGTYALTRYARSAFPSINDGRLRTFFPGIVASQIIALLLAVVYISHHLGWKLDLDVLTALEFLSTQYHAIILSTFSGIGFLFGIALIKIRSPVRWCDIGLCMPKATALRTFALIMIGLFVIILGGFLWATLSGSQFTRNTILLQALKGLSSRGSIYYVGYLIFLAPIIEEIFFRGILFSALKESLGVTVGLLAQALFFSAMHVSWAGFVPLFITGFVLGYVYHRSGSLLPSTMIHMLQSVIVVATIYAKNGGYVAKIFNL